MNEAKDISVRYYALFREQRGLSSERIRTDATTASELYEELKAIYGFSLPQEHLQIAINDQFARWEDRLEDGASVVFIPPVAGG